MPYDVHSAVGTFNIGTSTGNYSVTGLTFQPKLLIVWGTTQTTEDSTGTDHSRMVFGATDGTTHRNIYSSNLSATTSILNRVCADSGYLAQISNYQTGSVGFALDFTSFNSDGFTVNLVKAGTTSVLLQYLAVGGTDFKCKVGNSNTPINTNSVSGLGFTPTAVITGSTHNTLSWTRPTGSSAGSASSNDRFSVGFVDALAHHGSLAIPDANPTSSSSTKQRTDLIAMITSGWTISFDSDGFTLLGGSTNIPYMYIAIGGVPAGVGYFTKSASPTNSQTVTLNGQASSILFTSWGLPASTSSQSDKILSIGATDGSHDRSSWTRFQSGASPTVGRRKMRASKSIQMLDNSGTLLAEGSASITSTGFNVNWSTNDSTAAQILYLAIGAGAGALNRQPMIFITC